jgi:hypothetical protein
MEITQPFMAIIHCITTSEEYAKEVCLDLQSDPTVDSVGYETLKLIDFEGVI